MPRSVKYPTTRPRIEITVLRRPKTIAIAASDETES
jgi:hypothetical protein